jgi:hypothetical protein
MAQSSGTSQVQQMSATVAQRAAVVTALDETATIERVEQTATVVEVYDTTGARDQPPRLTSRTVTTSTVREHRGMTTRAGSVAEQDAAAEVESSASSAGSSQTEIAQKTVERKKTGLNWLHKTLIYVGIGAIIWVIIKLINKKKSWLKQAITTLSTGLKSWLKS